MKNLSPFKRVFVALFLLLFLALRSSAQCACGSLSDVNPGQYAHSYIPDYDANGFVKSYTYSFQFPCMGNTIGTSVPMYTYYILYREKGTSEWSVHSSSIYFDHPLFPGLRLKVGGLKPCTTYELRVTCPNCDPGPTNCGNAAEQLADFLADENNTLDNVSRIWEVCYAPIDLQSIKNVRVSGIKMSNNAVTVAWDHLPGEAVYEIAYRKTSEVTWTDAGTTTQFEHEISGLDACAEYYVSVRGRSDNCCGTTKYSTTSYLKLRFTDCMSMIQSVEDVTGNSALVRWTNVGLTTPDAYQVKWWPSNNSANVSTATVTNATEYVITGLNTNTTYIVNILSDCGSSACSGYSQNVSFVTNCEVYEPNNSFQTAAPITFNTYNDGANIHVTGDIDYYSFVPTDCNIEVKIHRPGEPETALFPWGCYTSLPYNYTLYDHNFEEVPLALPFVENNCTHPYTHWVTPGETYYLKVGGANEHQRLDCYRVGAFSCAPCAAVPASYTLDGSEYINNFPSSAYYGLSSIAYQVAWNVSGPAILTPNSTYPSLCQLTFLDAGIVTLTATITKCDGTQIELQKIIEVTDECNITGNFYDGFEKQPLLQDFTNQVAHSNYTISLNVPQGSGFTVTKLVGNATWTINGSQIIVNQLSNVVVFRIKWTEGMCNGVSGDFIFYKLSGLAPEDPVSWLINPNPTSDLLSITPSLSPGIDPNTIDQDLKIRVFDQNTTLRIYQQANTLAPTSINVSGLQPGNYTLQLLYGAHLKQISFVKL